MRAISASSTVARQAVRGNAEAHHSAGDRTGLDDRDLMPSRRR
jgi:hypothetical protein